MIAEVMLGAAKLRHALLVLVLVALTFSLFGGGLFGWLLFFDRESPIESISVDLYDAQRNRATLFRPGDTVLIKRTNCATRTVQVFISRELVREDGQSFTMPSGPFVLPPGCETNTNAVTLPAYLPAGSYTYRVTLSYEQNPLRRAEVVLKQPRLDVLP
jgi:hypothetical protein